MAPKSGCATCILKTMNFIREWFDLFVLAGIIIVIILNQEGECETPIRTYLYVYAVVIIVRYSIWALTKCFIKNPSCTKAIACLWVITTILMLLFAIVWFILGNVWYFGLDECDAFYEGYVLTLILLIIGYVIIGSIILFCGLACCGIAGLKMSMLSAQVKGE